jgi:chromosomal replication initiator protein
LIQSLTESDRWSEFRQALQASVSAANWQKWLSRLEPEILPDSVTLVVPSDFHLRWVQEKHGNDIEQAFRRSFGEDRELRFLVNKSDLPTEHPEPIRPHTAVPEKSFDSPSYSPFYRYSFDSFVVGPSNRFAYAAAMAVAEHPGSNYNPLFIYGPAGLGKTHLLHAVGQHVLELYPGLLVRYVSSEQFLNEFIDGIRRKRVDDFKHRYRSTDLLLLDDVQFFEGKEQILEEFFHTFNSLYESNKQMVISSDRHPRSLATLEARLRSRFEMGLLTDIQPPDVETRLAILRRNAEAAPRPVPLDVLEFIASVVYDNIRELEGALIRVTAFATLTHSDVSLAMAQEVLKDRVPGGQGKAVSPEDILAITAKSYGFSVSEVKGPSRRQPLVMCRQVAMYLCRELTDLSLPKIGNLFGGRDHTTVIHSIDKVQKMLQVDREVFDRVNTLSKDLRRP